MKRFLRDIKGLGLVEVLVAGAIAIVIVMGIGNMIVDSQRSQKNVELGQTAGYFANQLASMFTSSCPMVGSIYNAAATATYFDQSWPNIDMGGGPFTVSAGTLIPPYKDLKIASFRMRPLSSGAIYTVSGTTFQEHNAALYISFTKMGKTIGVQTTKETIMGISLLTNAATGIIVQCSLHGAVSGTSLAMSDYAALVNQADQMACQSLDGGLWIPPVGTTPGQCIFPSDCHYYGSFSQSTVGGSAQTSFFNPFTGGYGCPTSPAGIVAYKQGVVSTAISCGKSCVRSVYQDVMTCMKCGSAISLNGAPPPNPCGSCPSGYECQNGVSNSGWACVDPNTMFP